MRASGRKSELPKKITILSNSSLRTPSLEIIIRSVHKTHLTEFVIVQRGTEK